MTTDTIKALDADALWAAYSEGDFVSFERNTIARPTALLDTAMDFIETHPERHSQHVWMQSVPLAWTQPHDNDAPICGTAGCLAGWGIVFNKPIEGLQILSTPGVVILEGGEKWAHITTYAASLFGITASQAMVLFEPDWTITQLRDGVEAIKRQPEIRVGELRDLMIRVGELRDLMEATYDGED